MTTRTCAREDGFTLIELLVAMTLGLIVLFATLQTLDFFGSSAAQQTRATAANERARATIDRVVDDLRGAATIRTANATDLVYSVTEITGTRTERLCVAATSVLYGSTSATSTTPGTACGAVGSGWTQGVIATLPATTSTAFTYDGAASSATPALVRSVGLTFNLDASGGGRTQSSTLRSSATVRRSAGQLPINNSDVRAACNAGGALLSLDVGASTGLSALGVTYATSGGISLGVGSATSAVQIPEGITDIVATITDAAGVTNTIQKTVECS